MDKPTVSEALESWRAAERAAIRSTAKREAADAALEAAKLAMASARATADAAIAAQAAANEAVRTASATADAADKVLAGTQREAEAAHIAERDDLASERAAQIVHQDARERAGHRYPDGG